MTEPNPAYAPQRAYAIKQEALGLIKVTAWVPEDSRDEALDFIAMLREKHLVKRHGVELDS